MFFKMYIFTCTSVIINAETSFPCITTDVRKKKKKKSKRWRGRRDSRRMLMTYRMRSYFCATFVVFFFRGGFFILGPNCKSKFQTATQCLSVTATTTPRVSVCPASRSWRASCSVRNIYALKSLRLPGGAHVGPLHDVNKRASVFHNYLLQ